MSEKNMLWIRRETLVGIADAIRAKKGTTEEIPVTELASEISSIVGGESSWCGEYIDGSNYLTGAIVSYNGNIYICIKDLDDMQDPTNAEYWQMLNTEIPEFSEALALNGASEEEGEITIAYDLTEKVALPAATNKQLGTIADTNFIASNIKSGVSIFGLTGEYAGETVEEYDGSISIADLATEDALAGTWVFNDSITGLAFDVGCNFSSNGLTYSGIYRGAPSGALFYKIADADDVVVYSLGGWLDDAFRTIEVTTLLDDVVVNYVDIEDFMTWLQANATKQ